MQETIVNAEKAPLPTYEVEFIPVERRLKDRRKSSAVGYLGIERRRNRSRRDGERAARARLP